MFEVRSESGSSSASLPAQTAAIAKTCQGLTPTLGFSLFGSLGARVKLSSHVKNKKTANLCPQGKGPSNYMHVIYDGWGSGLSLVRLSSDGDERLVLGSYFLCIICILQPYFVLNWTNRLVYIYSEVRLSSAISTRCGTSNKTFEEPGHRWAFPGRQTHSPVCGRKEDKAFYSINRRKTRPFGPCRAQGEGPGKGGELVPAVCRQPRHMSSSLHSIPS